MNQPAQQLPEKERKMTEKHQPAAAAHPDDAAVDRFAIAMKAKLASARAMGRSGWDDPTQCTDQHLSDLLRRAMHKGNTVDVANYAMMLHQRGSKVVKPSLTKFIDAIKAAPKDAHAVVVDGQAVFLNRGTSEQDYSDAAAHEHRELEALIVDIKYLDGEIGLQMCDGAEVPEWVEAGVKVTLLISLPWIGQTS